MRRLLPVLLLLALLLPASARAEELDDGSVYALRDESGTYITSRAGRVYAGDEYISGDNQLYEVISVDDGAKTAVCAHRGAEPPADRAAFALADEKKKLICMYCTHSDESYVHGDGSESLTKGAGIYDVTEALKKSLEKKGVTVELSEETHLPHDAKAYSRSRRTAEDLLKSRPDALLDVHRDGIPDENEYETEVDGEETSKVRLLVGRSNPNADANRAFAKRIKAAADEKYPGLVKDIFIGKGNYNQELYPQALLLEFGTHTIDKERAVKATGYMADVLHGVLYGETANAAPSKETEREESRASASGIIWLVAVALVAAAVYALLATGKLGGMWNKLKRGTSELTGGAVGKKPDRRE